MSEISIYPGPATNDDNNKFYSFYVPQVVGSNWCVKCPEHVYACYIYNGMSLCEKHFKETQ